MKKVFYGIINTLSVLVILIAVIVLCVVLLTKPGHVPSIGGYMALRITTGSMEPTYPIDTMIVVKKTQASDIKVNDINYFVPIIGLRINKNEWHRNVLPIYPALADKIEEILR